MNSYLIKVNKEVVEREYKKFKELQSSLQNVNRNLLNDLGKFSEEISGAASDAFVQSILKMNILLEKDLVSIDMMYRDMEDFCYSIEETDDALSRAFNEVQ